MNDWVIVAALAVATANQHLVLGLMQIAAGVGCWMLYGYLMVRWEGGV